MWLASFALALAALAAEHNTLTPAEKASGWTLLFDGRTYQGWVDPASKEPPGDSWKIEDGCLVATRSPRILEDLVTAAEYTDFEFLFDWRIEPGGNSGVKYRILRSTFLIHTKPGYLEGQPSPRRALKPEERGHTYLHALEFQLIDDQRHADAQRGPDRGTGALYGYAAPSKHAERPAGEWNTSRLIVRGELVEHWVNGVRVLASALSADVLSKSKSPSAIALQNHGDSSVAFRNLKLRPLVQ
ncbi:MAG: DUF1080 domain-containing protein [Bryobacteraceae bacterium]|nr:DUF1080 domain-containing protein [Bryobacteraceae bacterium]